MRADYPEKEAFCIHMYLGTGIYYDKDEGDPTNLSFYSFVRTFVEFHPPPGLSLRDSLSLPLLSHSGDDNICPPCYTVFTKWPLLRRHLLPKWLLWDQQIVTSMPTLASPVISPTTIWIRPSSTVQLSANCGRPRLTAKNK